MFVIPVPHCLVSCIPIRCILYLLASWFLKAPSQLVHRTFYVAKFRVSCNLFLVSPPLLPTISLYFNRLPYTCVVRVSVVWFHELRFFVFLLIPLECLQHDYSDITSRQCLVADYLFFLPLFFVLCSLFNDCLYLSLFYDEIVFHIFFHSSKFMFICHYFQLSLKCFLFLVLQFYHLLFFPPEKPPPLWCCALLTPFKGST